ncbi:hypothetical protein [Thermosulfuriphilus sp.]
MKIRWLWLLLMALCLTAWEASAHAQPFKGYDVNTEISLEGTVTKIIRKKNILVLRVRDKDYRLLLGPRWFTKKLGLSPRPGDRIEVTGSKLFGRDGRIYILCRIVRWKKENFFLRDEDGHPLWSKSR